MAQLRAMNGRRDLTLRDRLSRLTFTQACKSLGPGADRLIRRGGARDIRTDEQVHLGDDLFRLSLNGAVVTITLMADAPHRLRWNCTRCPGACEHVGAAFSLVLEEKVALGLAAPPPARAPLESLGEKELVARAVAERDERSRKERMSIRSTDPKTLWTDYLVANATSGKTYRVALRGWNPGDSYCTCPDFRKNTLGICKHVLAVQRRVRARFPAAARRRTYRPRDFAVHLRYGDDLELRLLAPDRLEAPVTNIVRPFADGPIQDVRALTRCVERLASLGHEVTVYPDAEEYIHRQFFRDRVANLTTEIRRDAARHPLRRELLNVELLPYQLDGIAFAVGAGRAILGRVALSESYLLPCATAL